MRRETSEFDEFYSSRMPGLSHMLFLACGDRERSEDCAQEAFVRAWRRWDSLDGQDPIAWVRTVAWRLCIDDWRSSRRIQNALRDLRPPATSALATERHEALDLVIDLPPPIRSIVVLHYIEDLSIEEVAEMLQIPAGTVKSRLSRGRDRLRRSHAVRESWRE
jgi:RNA polymerase sigma-70 factor (ECF subfamily)